MGWLEVFDILPDLLRTDGARNHGGDDRMTQAGIATRPPTIGTS